MKKYLSFVVVTVMLLAAAPVYAADTSGFAPAESVSIEYLEDGSYYETIIEDAEDLQPVDAIVPFASPKTATKSKTTKYKNSSGQVLWYVKVTGTFTYGNGSAKCTKATPSAASNSPYWKVSGISGSKSGNKASAKATGTHYMGSGHVPPLTKTVTLTCSPSGDFS
ncbi:MAG: hypothetical protein HFH41_14280 [Lachnospiraceae bacterium]|nr:hypothetical protein [Lachnospiraceae bacterium]